MSMIEGPSTDPSIIDLVKAKAAGKAPILIVLDSDHTHEHILGELNAYAPLTTVGSYCIVDTVSRLS